MKITLPDIDMEVASVLRPIAEFTSKVVFASFADVSFIVLCLVVLSLLFTVYLGVPNIRGFVLAVRHIQGAFDDPRAPGEISYYQTISAAITGSVSVANIAGVAYGVRIGGPGSVFWMCISGIFCMSMKLIEVTMAVRYREKQTDGSVMGGPIQYLALSLKEHNWSRMGKFLAYFYAFAMLFAALGAGCMFPANVVYSQALRVTGGTQSWLYHKGWCFGIFLGLLFATAIIGGARFVSKVACYLRPIMSFCYVFGCVAILVSAHRVLPATLKLVLSEAFHTKSLYGGFLPVLITGYRRGIFSNECGIGSSTIAQAQAKTTQPVAQGLVALLEPLIDTTMVCTLTGLVVVVVGIPSGLVDSDLDGMQLTSACFEHFFALPSWAFLPMVFFFAYTTMVTWVFYGLIAFGAIFGIGRYRTLTYKILYCLVIVVGCCSPMEVVLELADALVFLMAFPNAVALLISAPSVKQELTTYMAECQLGLAGRQGNQLHQHQDLEQADSAQHGNELRKPLLRSPTEEHPLSPEGIFAAQPHSSCSRRSG